MTSFTLQSCFYTLLEPEIIVVSKAYLSVHQSNQKVYKKFEKNISKFTNSYLLDTLDLNTKSRCVFAWSDPEFNGFKPIPDDRSLNKQFLLDGIDKYFKEAEDIGHKFISDLIGERRMYYEDNREFSSTIRYGVVFVICTCMIDWYICMM